MSIAGLPWIMALEAPIESARGSATDGEGQYGRKEE